MGNRPIKRLSIDGGVSMETIPKSSTEIDDLTHLNISQIGYMNNDELNVANQELFINPIPLRRKEVYFAVKRLFDIIVSAAALVIISPVLFVVASRSKVFFHQPRIGWKGTEFRCHNLRSMELVRRLYKILEQIRAIFSADQTTNLHNAHFRHQSAGFPAVKIG